MEIDKKLLAKFYFYLSEYEDLRFAFADEISKAGDYPGKLAHQEALMTHAADTSDLMYYIGKMLNVLEIGYTELNEVDQLNRLHAFFDDLDINISLGVINNHDTGLQSHQATIVYEECFINTSFFWKSISENSSTFHLRDATPAGSGFKSFGICKKNIKYNVVNIADFLDERTGVSPFKKIKNLKIGLFPLSDEYQIDFKLTRITNPERNTVGFVTNNTGNELQKQELKKTFDAIKESGLHIASLPEMILSEDLINYLKSLITNDPPEFLILIAGTYHKSYKGVKYKNTMPILVIHGNEIYHYEYAKMEPFETTFKSIDKAHKLKNGENFELVKGFAENHPLDSETFLEICNLKEDSVSDNEILILNCGEIGNLGFMICRDFIVEQSDLIASYQSLSDHIFISSYNFAPSADFPGRASHLCGAKKIASFYVNARASDPNSTSPTFYHVPNLKRKKTDEQPVSSVIRKQDPCLIEPEEPFLVYEIEIPKKRKNYV